jgi:uncharacterized membrane protein YfcA
MHDLLLETLGSLSPWAMVYAAIVVFLSAVLRGFAGFGFALAGVPLLSLILPPVEVVPAVAAIGIPAGLLLIGKIGRAADWRSTGHLTIGAIVGLPPGVWALASLPSNVMRAIIGAIVLVAVFLLWRGFRFRRTPPIPARIGMGFLSGLINGATTMGGPPVIIYYLAMPGAVAVGRASILAYFFFLSIATTASTWIAGLLTMKVVAWTALMLPCFFLGSWLGDRGFDKSGAETYRRVALVALALVAIVAIVRAGAGLMGG